MTRADGDIGGRQERARAVLGAMVVLFAVACIYGATAGLSTLVYVAKPAATTCVLMFALVGASRVSPRYRVLIATGLVFGLGGDVLLMLPGDWFIPGLASFLVGHLCYAAAFAGAGGGWRGPGAAMLVGSIGAAMLVILWPALGAVRVPVVLYVAVIAVMAWQAIARWQGGVPDEARDAARDGAALAAAGALVFMVSDGALALQRFRGDFNGGRALVLGTYWLAQFLIAASAGSAASRRAAVSSPYAV